MSEEQKLDPRLHFVVATAIIEKGGKFLIAKRAAREIVFPNKWTVPGGKLVLSEYKNLPKKAGKNKTIFFPQRKEFLPLMEEDFFPVQTYAHNE